jgi:osmoprotectant transport system ATP-binding protein
MRFRLDGVTRRYGPVGTAAALSALDLEFADGSVTAVIGSSGSGKSTLLRLLLGLEQPDAGTVSVDDRPLTRQPLQALRRRIGYVIQDGGLFPHLSVRGNLALLPRELGWSAARIDARAAELCERVALPPELLRRAPDALSGGQRQRVALMRALMADPPALLLDEPLGALDPIVRHELQDELRRMFASLGKTVILVTHDLAEAAFLAPRLVLLHDGRVAQDGRFTDLQQCPASDFVARFLAAQRRLPAA